MTLKKRLIIGITGASGALIGINMLKALKYEKDWESHLVISDGGEKTINLESSYSVKEVKALADYNYSISDIAGAIASGSFKTQGMIIVPCSMKSLAGINLGYSDNLLLRAADVVLKERRKLVLITREAPLSHIHLKNMLEVTNMGGIIMPPVLTFYNKPSTIEDMINHMIGKIFDLFDIEYNKFLRWS